MRDIKDELKEIEYLDFKINESLKELEQLRHYTDVLKGLDYSRERVKSSNRSDVADTIVKIVDLENLINRDIDRLINKKSVLKSKIGTLEPKLYQILYLRYFKFYRWYSVAAELNYDLDYVKKLHGIALQRLRRKDDTK